MTYTSNALEGNTLTRQETAVVLEKGLTIGGKTLREHIEVINHEQALIFIKSLSEKKGMSEVELLQLHALILNGIDNSNAGRYRDVAVRISGSATILPNPRKVPELMAHFFANIMAQNNHPVTKAAIAHYEWVTIHPFIDGNGRSARLLMNLLLIQNGYPPAIVRTHDRLRYLRLLEQAQTGGEVEAFLKFIYTCVDKSFDIYLKAMQGQTVDVPFSHKPKGYYRIGEVAKLAHESVATLRFWTRKGLLKTIGETNAGYAIYDTQSIERIQKIRSFQTDKKSLEEIHTLFEKEDAQSFVES